jgi:hypothetical protein
MVGTVGVHEIAKDLTASLWADVAHKILEPPMIGTAPKQLFAQN